MLLPDTAVSLTSLTVWAHVTPDEREYYRMIKYNHFNLKVYFGYHDSGI
jgi:hypothetical protein